MRTAVDRLFSLETLGIKFGLDNITALVDALGRPDRAFTSVHVAGTNGKGSVTAMVDAMLRAAGHRTGRYTSPHLIDLAERFVVDGTPVAAQVLEDAAATVLRVTDRLLANGGLSAPPTFFEATTATAFEVFRTAGVETAVCEVGLGGRLDATNVIDPAVTAITSIGFDHQQYLGETLAAIAAEKAGIIKRGVPVVVGRVPADAMAVIAETAQVRGARVIRAQQDAAAIEGGFRTAARAYSARLALPGNHQLDNALVAVLVAEQLDRAGVSVPAEAVVAGLETVRWPGRLELRRFPDGREVLLDAAHNPDGITAFASYLRETGRAGLPIVFGVMRDKNADEMLRRLAAAAGHFIFTPTSNARSTDVATLMTIAARVAPSITTSAAGSVGEALHIAWQRGPRIAVGGSIFLVGDALKTLEGS